MFLKIDHIGIAVESIAGRAKLYTEQIGMPLGVIETVASEDVRVAFLGSGETHIELLEPLSEEGPVAKFIARKGEGIHHVCLEVENIDRTIERLAGSGVRLVGDAPRPGAGGCRVAFVHPRDAGGVLLELSEQPPGRGETVGPGQTVVVYLRDPKERFWGVLREISTLGATVEGIDLSSFDPWLASAAKGEASATASCVLFPQHRIERVLLDRPSGGAESLEQRFRGRVGRGLSDYLVRGRQPED